jgi:hypothetical protein
VEDAFGDKQNAGKKLSTMFLTLPIIWCIFTSQNGKKVSNLNDHFHEEIIDQSAFEDL